MTDEQSLARRLVACKHFRWMPGMLPKRSQDTRFKTTNSQEGWLGTLPDLADPATLGCIEHGLLPDAWDPDCFLFRGPLGWGWGKGATSFIEPQPTKAEALVAALEAAP